MSSVEAAERAMWTQFAGNVLCHGAVSPCDGDWYGGITQENASSFLNALVNVPVGSQAGDLANYCCLCV